MKRDKSCKTCALREEIHFSTYINKVKCRKYGNVYLRISCLEHQTMSCANCRFMNKIKVKSSREKTDDGDIHYKYLYEWTIDCEKEGEIKTRLEGTKHKATIPTCSLWEYGEKKK